MGFDFKTLKKPTLFEQGAVVKKEITTIPIRKPDKREFFRVRPDWSAYVYILEARTGAYLVGNIALEEAAATKCLKAVELFYLIANLEPEPFFSYIALPSLDGADNEYNKSRREAFKMAESEWIKITANQKNGFYEVVKPISKYPEPEWPEEPSIFEKAVELAFKDLYIDSPDHPVLKELRGEL